jgi:hypothetical protein
LTRTIAKAFAFSIDGPALPFFGLAKRLVPGVMTMRIIDPFEIVNAINAA